MFFLIGNPENRRVGLFQEALQRAGQPPAVVVPYLRLLGDKRLVAFDPPAGSLLRLESPGENAAVERLLVLDEAGALPPDARAALELAGREIEHGEIFQPRVWFLGYRRLLERLQAECEPRGVGWMNHPADIAQMFDKHACRQRLAESGVPTPPSLGLVGRYEELRQRMNDAGARRVFVKLRHGSSASGVVALESGGSRLRATTTVEMVREAGGTRLFNSLRLRRYEDERDVAELIDALGRHDELTVERWLPKAGFRGAVFDLRVVVIAGEVRHVVMRTSRGPLTNLHLGNRRGDVDALFRELPPTAREAAWRDCRRVAEIFPRSLYFGLDLMFTPGFRRHAVLEVNAFGDLLPGVLDRGQSTYEAEIAAALAGRAAEG